MLRHLRRSRHEVRRLPAEQAVEPAIGLAVVRHEGGVTQLASRIRVELLEREQALEPVIPSQAGQECARHPLDDDEQDVLRPPRERVDRLTRPVSGQFGKELEHRRRRVDHETLFARGRVPQVVNVVVDEVQLTPVGSPFARGPERVRAEEDAREDQPPECETTRGALEAAPRAVQTHGEQRDQQERPRDRQSRAQHEGRIAEVLEIQRGRERAELANHLEVQVVTDDPERGECQRERAGAAANREHQTEGSRGDGEIGDDAPKVADIHARVTIPDRTEAQSQGRADGGEQR